MKNARATFGCNAVKPRVITQLHPVAITARNSTGCITPKLILSRLPDRVGNERFLQPFSERSRVLFWGLVRSKPEKPRAKIFCVELGRTEQNQRTHSNFLTTYNARPPANSPWPHLSLRTSPPTSTSTPPVTSPTTDVCTRTHQADATWLTKRGDVPLAFFFSPMASAAASATPSSALRWRLCLCRGRE